MSYYPSINIGDIVVRDKMFGVVKHIGIVVGYDTILHNTPERGEHFTSYEGFAAGKTVVIQTTGINSFVVEMGVHRILAKPKKYDPIVRNCEHTVSDVLGYRPQSPQVVAALAGLFTLGLFAIGTALLSQSK